MEKELKQILELFLGFNKISVNKEELHLQLITHPYFPSVHAITDLFDHFNIENIAAELPKEAHIISELPDNFLAHIKEEGNGKIVLVVKKAGELQLIYGNKKTKLVAVEQFIELWTGVVVAIEKDENTIQTNTKNQQRIKPFIIAVLLLLALSVLILNPLSFLGYGYLLCSSIGFYISILLVQKELGLHSKSLDKFCEASKNNSCDDVLNSKGATLFGFLKLSDVGIVYFLSIIFSVLIFNLLQSENEYQLITGLSILALLFVPYSIYYQWIIIKKWCPLCLLVIGVLLVQGFLSLFFINTTFILDYLEIGIVLFSFLLLSVFWLELKAGYKKKQEFHALQLEYYKFKRNANLFMIALKSSDKKEMAIDGIHEIVLGNKKASLQIVLVTNPMCFFCKEAHQVFHNILKSKKEEIQLTIRFSINLSKDKSNLGLAIANQLLEIYKNKNEEETIQALDEVYSEMLPEVWLKKWNTNPSLDFVFELEQAKEWSAKHAVNFTPAVFVNGYLFPKEYQKKDISFFIDHLIEEEL